MDYGKIKEAAQNYQEDMVKFLRAIVKNPGESCDERKHIETIEAEMKKIVKENIPVKKRIITVEEGRSIFAGQDYKLELLEEYAEKGWELSIYTQGDFTDLCAGPHLMSTGTIKAIKLTQATSAYWRGDSSRDTMCRMYCIAFPKASELEAYLKQQE